MTSSTDPRRIAQVFLWALPLLATIALPGLSWVTTGHPYAPPLRLALMMNLFVALVAIATFVVVYRLSTRGLRWSLAVAAMFNLVLFQWWILALGSDAIVDVIPIGFLAEAVPVAVAAGFLWLSVRMGEERGFLIVTSVGLWAIVIALLAVIVSLLPAVPDAADADPTDPDLPDVLLLVLDGYPRADVLDSVFGFDNSQFLDSLEAMGFEVADQAQANYSYTYAALSSMLAMDYVFDVGPIGDEERENMRHALAGDSPLMREFKENGYDIAYFVNAWQGSTCSPYVDTCVRDGLVEHALWNLGRTTIFANLYSIVRPNPFVSVSVSHLRSFDTLFTERGDAPLLTVFHAIVPHPPLLLTDQCRIVASPEQSGFDASTPATQANGRRLFVEQTKCVNSLVVEGVARIVAANPDTIVMITGDHGTSSTLAFGDEEREVAIPDALRERMSILSAYRLPGCEDRVYPTMTPVNGTRAVADCALGNDLARVPDRTLWTTEHKTGEVIDVADRIPG